MPLGMRAIRPLRLALIDTARAKAGAQRANDNFIHKVQARLMKYPPIVPGQRYRRTGDLGKGWSAPGSVKVTPYVAILVNRVFYANPVQGRHDPTGGQLPYFAARKWPSIQDVVREEKKFYPSLVTREIKGRIGAT